MRKIGGEAKTIRALLANAKYAVDYYQREYRWATKQVSELVDDLTSKFFESHEAGNERQDVENYGHYFLGSIIVSNKDGRKFVIDGQQRLTTLSLVLIHLFRSLEDEEQKSQVAELIFSQKFGKKSFNLDVPERADCMDAIYHGHDFDDSDRSESVQNIVARFKDIEECFPNEIDDDALPFFCDWLIENVHLVEISAYSDDDAYTIFETMNDRGLSLTPTDMLKGYLLANITDDDSRNGASRTWKNRIASLSGIGKEEDADAIKSWLRSQHAVTIRERKRGAEPRDFDLIGTEFHRWVRDHQDDLGLLKSNDFSQLIEREFAFYTKHYEILRNAAEEFSQSHEHVYYNAHQNFTLQYPVILAPLKTTDSDSEITRKIRVTSAFINVLISRRIWNFRAIDYSTMQYAMFQLMKEIRGKDIGELVEVLTKKLNDEEETFETNERFRLHGQNGRQIHRILARMIAFVETESGMPSRYVEYSKRSGKDGYEVEHIWANHPERHVDEFSHPSDFEEYRNRIGGLLLLPKKFNASFGDLTYEKKRKQYNSQNQLARSLCDECYDHNPGFKRFVKNSELPFKPHAEFKKSDLDERQKLYIALAETAWSPQILGELSMS